MPDSQSGTGCTCGNPTTIYTYKRVYNIYIYISVHHALYTNGKKEGEEEGEGEGEGGGGGEKRRREKKK